MLLNIIGYILILTSIISTIKNYKNNILILLSLELFFVGLAILYIHIGLEFDDFIPITIAIFILCLSATESALGLTILMINNPGGATTRGKTSGLKKNSSPQIENRN